MLFVLNFVMVYSCFMGFVFLRLFFFLVDRQQITDLNFRGFDRHTGSYHSLITYMVQPKQLYMSYVYVRVGGWVWVQVQVCVFVPMYMCVYYLHIIKFNTSSERYIYEHAFVKIRNDFKLWILLKYNITGVSLPLLFAQNKM